MADNEAPSLAALLTRLRLLLREPIDFTRTDTETTLIKVRVLTAGAMYFNVLAVADFGGRPGPSRGEGLIEQAVAAAFQIYEGEDPHCHRCLWPRPTGLTRSRRIGGRRQTEAPARTSVGRGDSVQICGVLESGRSRLPGRAPALGQAR